MEGTVFMRKRFCPDCGATSKPFIENVCIDCFQKKNKLLMYPQKIEIMYFYYFLRWLSSGHIFLYGKIPI